MSMAARNEHGGSELSLGHCEIANLCDSGNDMWDTAQWLALLVWNNLYENIPTTTMEAELKLN